MLKRFFSLSAVRLRFSHPIISFEFILDLISALRNHLVVVFVLKMMFLMLAIAILMSYLSCHTVPAVIPCFVWSQTAVMLAMCSRPTTCRCLSSRSRF